MLRHVQLGSHRTRQWGGRNYLVCVFFDRRYRKGVRGWELSREMSVSDKPWEGPAVEMRWWRSWL